MGHEITIYRSDRSIWALPIRPDDGEALATSPMFIARPDDVPIASWSVYEFEPRPFASKDGASFRKLRMASVPIRIASTAAVKLIGEGPKARLSVWWSPMGIDAGAVHYVARRGEKGMRVIDETADRSDRGSTVPAGGPEIPVSLAREADAGEPAYL